MKNLNMTHQFDILKKTRSAILRIIDPFTLEQINKVPSGHKNNIAWNIAHLMVTQQLLCYKNSGLPMYISDEIVEKFKKGTKTEGDLSKEEFEEVKRLFLELPEKLEADYNNGIFKNYNAYTTSLNVTLSNIETALAFSNFHEGIHLGVLFGLKKLI
ncbi:DinB family protein [Urechidicola vernalis]|uniref:DinB family protein n=1 Tax=Urechidicola vernalis TaxID=3075600 RepID=A0ABU2Y680_9FLAO|nr:DinB family protein [Urechidicola sp. P050]MDT0553717.1 DinB family protein [Urechidicola sp. P050]